MLLDELESIQSNANKDQGSTDERKEQEIIENDSEDEVILMYSKQESFNDDTSDVEKDVNIKETQVTVQSVLDIAFNDKEVIQLDHSMPNNEANFEYAEEFETNSQDENNVLTDEITLFDNESEITKNLDGTFSMQVDDGLVDDELVDHQHKNSSSSKKKKTKRKYEMQDREVFINGERKGPLCRHPSYSYLGRFLPYPLSRRLIFCMVFGDTHRVQKIPSIRF